MSVRVIYKDVAVGADTDAVMSANGGETFSTITFLPFGSGNEKKYATLEKNFWLLNGEQKIYDGGVVAFWSNELSRDDCTFENTPEITATMDEQYNSLGVSLDFGEMNICAEVEIIWYRGSTELSRKTFYPDVTPYFCENSVELYNRIVVRLVKTSHPMQRARLDSLSFGIIRTFNQQNLRNVRVTQQINLISKELPENVLDWGINSPTEIDYIFQRKQPVEAYSGTKLVGVFYIRDSNRKSAKTYDVSCVDAIGVLDDDPFPDAVYTNKNALELAREICGDFDVEMDAALQAKTVTGATVGYTRRVALQQLCFAIGAVADTSGSQAIKIFAPPLSAPTEIERSRVRTGATVSKSAVVTAVKITAHSYSTSGSGNSVEIGGVTYYDTQTVVTINNPNITATDKQNVISIPDGTFVSPANVNEVAQRVFDYYMRRDTHKFKFRLENENVGDYVTSPTPWGDLITGNYVSGTIVLSNIAVTNAEVVGT